MIVSFVYLYKFELLIYIYFNNYNIPIIIKLFLQFLSLSNVFMKKIHPEDKKSIPRQIKTCLFKITNKQCYNVIFHNL